MGSTPPAPPTIPTSILECLASNQAQNQQIQAQNQQIRRDRHNTPTTHKMGQPHVSEHKCYQEQGDVAGKNCRLQVAMITASFTEKSSKSCGVNRCAFRSQHLNCNVFLPSKQRKPLEDAPQIVRDRRSLVLEVVRF